MPSTEDDGERALLRHTVATLAYRGAKALREAPAGFADHSAGSGARTPLQVLAHVGDLLDWALSQARGEERWSNTEPGDWNAQISRFFEGLEALEAYLASDAPLMQPPERIFQGAVADALAHVGQLTLLRRLAGSSIRGENYSRAPIAAGRVGADQDPPQYEFD